MSRIEPLTPIFQTGPRPVASVDPSASRFLQVPSLAPATSPSPPRSPYDSPISGDKIDLGLITILDRTFHAHQLGHCL